jgi:hypothetical protein
VTDFKIPHSEEKSRGGKPMGSQFIQILPLDSGYKVNGPEGMEGFFDQKNKTGMINYIKKNLQYLHNPITDDRKPTEGTEVE